MTIEGWLPTSLPRAILGCRSGMSLFISTARPGPASASAWTFRVMGVMRVTKVPCPEATSMTMVSTFRFHDADAAPIVGPPTFAGSFGGNVAIGLTFDELTELRILINQFPSEAVPWQVHVRAVCARLASVVCEGLKVLDSQFLGIVEDMDESVLERWI